MAGFAQGGSRIEVTCQPQKGAWDIALAEVTMHPCIYNPLCPRDPAFPSLALLPIANASSEDLRTALGLYLSSKEWTQFDLLKVLHKNPTSVNLMYVSEKDAVLLTHPPVVVRRYLYIHQGLADYLLGDNDHVQVTYKEGESYVVLDLSTWPVSKSFNLRLFQSRWPLPDTTVDPIVPTLKIFCRDTASTLAVLYPPLTYDEDAPLYHWEPIRIDAHPLTVYPSSSIALTLLDARDKPLTLRGPVYVKLIMQPSRKKKKKRHIIQGVVMPPSTRFVVTLPQPLVPRHGSHWTIALKSIVFPVIPLLELSLRDRTFTLTLDGQTMTFVLPASIADVKALGNTFEFLTNRKLFATIDGKLLTLASSNLPFTLGMTSAAREWLNLRTDSNNVSSLSCKPKLPAPPVVVTMTCDEVHPTLMNGVWKRQLRMLPTHNTVRGHAFVECGRLDDLPLSMDRLTELHMNLEDEHGHLLKMDPDRAGDAIHYFIYLNSTDEE